MKLSSTILRTSLLASLLVLAGCTSQQSNECKLRCLWCVYVDLVCEEVHTRTTEEIDPTLPTEMKTGDSDD